MKMTELIATLPELGQHEQYPKATTEEIRQTEESLGFSLPESYKTFVSQFSNGSYLLMMQEVSGVGSGNEQISAIQDLYPIREESFYSDQEQSLDVIPIREGGEVKREALVPFSLDSNGNAWCFIVKQGIGHSEYPVVYLDFHNPKLYGRLSGGFNEWLEILVREKDEVIKTLYDEDVLYDELQLG